MHRGRLNYNTHLVTSHRVGCGARAGEIINAPVKT